MRLHPLCIDFLGPIIRRHTPVILLDTARPSAENRRSLLFVKPIRVHVCRSIDLVPAFLRTLADETKRHWVAGHLSYEAAYGLEERLRKATRQRSGQPLGWFGVFEKPFIYDHRTGRWDDAPPSARNRSAASTGNGSLITLKHRISDEKYRHAILSIKRLIARGDLYQANFTYDTLLSTTLDEWDLYLHLRKCQPVPFSAFIRTDHATILSLSPELFFSVNKNTIRVKPMKGTAKRGRTNDDDRRIAAALAEDGKNRSENVMIVDLLRNDLGRICETGSVRTTSLFDVERHPSLFQMTSEVEGRLRRGQDFYDIFASLFPSGSVTGAPKIRAMEVLREIERGPRGIYCGAIGYSSPARLAIFSVPIRTLQKGRSHKTWQYRVGGGIVWDSMAADERRECHTKCSFLTSPPPSFGLVESMLFARGRFTRLREHRRRLADSSGYFDFPFDRRAWESLIAEIRATLGDKPPCKIRILLDKTGTLSWIHEKIGAPTSHRPCNVVLSKHPLDPSNPFLFHKTTHRPWYEAATRLIAGGKCFDIIHWNPRGELTEGARSNLFVKIDGKLCTPPTSCGLLPGVLRSRLLNTGRCAERILRLPDLRKADAVYCGNSVRGLVAVAFSRT